MSAARKNRSFLGGTAIGHVPTSSVGSPTGNGRGGRADGKARRPYGWLLLLVATSLVLTTVWYREGATGPLHKVRAGVQTVTTPLGAAGKWVTTPLRSFVFWVSDLGVSRSQLQALREQNETLRARVVQLEEMTLENQRLKALVGEPADTTGVGAGTTAAASTETTNLAAAVIGLPDNSYDQTIVINKGTSAGVVLNQPVASARGLVGQIMEVGPTYAKVRLITDQNSGVAARVQRSRQTGIVRGTLDGELTLDFVPLDAEVKVGDVVLTSGLGGIYPKGLVIGEITSVSDEINTLYRSISVQPTTTLKGLEEVLILVNTPPDTAHLPEAQHTAAGYSDSTGASGSGSGSGGSR